MQYSDISDADWKALVEAITLPDNSFNLHDLRRAVMAKFNLDEATAKQFVRRHDRRMCGPTGIRLGKKIERLTSTRKPHRPDAGIQ
jgi:hypothetical protein